jgi:hypothetical protein
VDLGDPVAVKRQERGLDDVDHPAVPTRRRDVLGLRPDDPELDYTCADEHAYRLFWDPDSQKLSIDDSWTVPYLAEGQSTGDAPGIMGDWITIQTNGIGGEVPSSVVAINQRDSSRSTTVVPFGPLMQMSLAPPRRASTSTSDQLP